MKRIVHTIVFLLMLTLAAGAKAELVMKKNTSAKSAPNTEYTDPTTGMQFVLVAGGCYMMGNVFNDKDGSNDEKPVHEVCVDDFYMGKYEVTQAEWTGIMGNNPSKFRGEKLPVEQVSWDDVQGFITRLNEKGGKQSRLPTEAEWEYAARSGGKKEKWAGTIDEKQLENYAWYYSETTHPVGQKRPNGLGLYDMSGNVKEWCSDWHGLGTYDDDFIRDKPRNPQGASGGSFRVVRGGSFNYEARDLRVVKRGGDPPSVRGYYLGFRLVSPVR
jgi:formylglycine-generating enzyme required for sulfatase activity